jgi:hypothetical protein
LLLRLSSRGGSSLFAVKVFKPPVARSQECVAKLVARSCAIIVEASVSEASGFKEVEGKEEGARVMGIEWLVGIEWIE